MSYLREYLDAVPTALAIIRISECIRLQDVELPRPILDLGSGDGIFASLFFREPVDFGIDISEKETRLAIRRGAYTHLSVADAHQMPFRSDMFGTVFSNSVLEHIPDIQQVMREVHRVLRPGGVVVFTVPTPQFDDLLLFSTILRRVGLSRLAAYYGHRINRVFRHMNLSDFSAWEKTLKDAGLRVIEYRQFIGAEAMQVHDLFLVPALLGKLNHRFLGKWIIWPAFRRRLITPLLSRALAHRVGRTASVGASQLLVARKG